MKRYFPKTATAWNTALVELRRWNKSRALVCNRGCQWPRRRTRADMVQFHAALHERDFPGHAVRIKRFG